MLLLELQSGRIVGIVARLGDGVVYHFEYRLANPLERNGVFGVVSLAFLAGLLVWIWGGGLRELLLIFGIQ